MRKRNNVMERYRKERCDQQQFGISLLTQQIDSIIKKRKEKRKKLKTKMFIRQHPHTNNQKPMKTSLLPE